MVITINDNRFIKRYLIQEDFTNNMASIIKEIKRLIMFNLLHVLYKIIIKLNLDTIFYLQVTESKLRYITYTVTTKGK